MFRYGYPVFEHKNLLKKDMLDELRDYPLCLSQMYFTGYGDGILEGCNLSWEKDVLYLGTGLILYQGNIFRMVEPCPLECPPTDHLTFLKVRFSTTDDKRGWRSGVGEILLNTEPVENGEMELGRFRLQEGARLRTEYENFEDYQTEYDTVNRIHVPYAGAGGAGMWPQLLKVYVRELLETGTMDVHDVSFAMTVLGSDGHITTECIRWYLLRSGDEVRETLTNGEYYKKLLSILKVRKSGGAGWKKPDGDRKQMLLI